MKNSKKVAFCGLFLALALVAGYVERLIPINLGIPGVKIGLANIVTMVLLYCAGWPIALAITTARVILTGFLFGSLSSMIYSGAGAAMSMLVMILLQKTKKFHAIGVSVAGGVFHNVGQILMAMYVAETGALIYYLPVLILSGLGAGIFVGLLGGWLTSRLRPVLRQEFGEIGGK